QLWIGLLIGAGCLAAGAAIQGSSYAWLRDPTVWVFVVAATVAHAFPVIAPRHQAYHVTQAFLMASALLLSWPGVALVIVVAHVAEWVRRRRPWYIQAYNVAVYLYSAAVAMAVIVALGGAPFDPRDGRSLVAAIGGALAFVFVNHALTAAVLRIARGVRVTDSGLFGRHSLGLDGALLLFGVVMAGAWLTQPLAFVVLCAPLALTYRALTMTNLEVTSHRDALSGLYNARHFGEALDLELRRAQAQALPTSVLVAVVDEAPALVQRYGRATLDFMVAAIGARVQRVGRDFDLTARLGDGSVALLAPGVDHQNAAMLAGLLREAVSLNPLPVPTVREPIAASVSVVLSTIGVSAGTYAAEVMSDIERAVERARVLGPGALVPVTTTSSATDQPGVDLAASPASITPAAETSPHRQWVGSPRMLVALEVVVIALAFVASGLVVLEVGLPPGPLAAGTIGLVLLAEMLAFELYDRSSFSISFVPILAAGLLGGPAGTLVATWSVAVVRGLQRRSRWDKVLFNAGCFSLFGLLATAIAAAGGPLTLGLTELIALIAATIVASAVYYLHTFLIALAVAIDIKTDPRLVWARNFRWLFPHYLVLGAMGLGLAIATVQLGPLGSALFVVPPLMMRLVLKQYTDRTAGAVQRLEVANAELQATSSLLQRRGDELALLSDLGRLAASEPRATSLPSLVATRCVPALGEVCAMVWHATEDTNAAVSSVAGGHPVAEALRQHLAADLLILGASVHSALPLADWAVRLGGEWAASPLPGADNVLGWMVVWSPSRWAVDERGGRLDVMREVAGRLALVLERDALLDEAAAVDARRAVDRARTDFVAITAHELRTPLTSLQGFAELLRNDVEPQVRDRWLRIVQAEAAQLGLVLDQLLDVSKLDSGRFVAQRQAFALRPLLQAVVDGYAEQAILGGHHVTADVVDGPPIYADGAQVERVLRSLLSNALKYSPEGGVIRVTAITRDGDVEVCVEDAGLGIPAEWLGRLFERFQRIDLPERASIRGTGLGLYIARQLVEMNGGRIWVTSDGLGRGSVFHFTVPIAVRVRHHPLESRAAN
ncbi:MAG TPA: ATP-binding protein, partial [Chloroflexota bacterium]|nr:ATP-binding protein [Chloroflexota bacterium]